MKSGIVNEILPNSVRSGIMQGHKDDKKRLYNGQVWFPQDWTDDDILVAATAIINNPDNAISKNKYSGKYKRNNKDVAMVIHTNKQGSIYPDKDNQPKE